MLGVYYFNCEGKVRVKVQYTKTGKIAFMNDRMAGVLFKVGMIAYVKEDAPQRTAPDEVLQSTLNALPKAKAEDEPRKRGRPRKQTYDTRDMVAK